MNRRVIFLIVIAALVWVVVVMYLFVFNMKSPAKVGESEINESVPPMMKSMSNRDLEKIRQLLSEGTYVPEMFTPYMITFNRDTINSDMLFQMQGLNTYRFVGYLSGTQEARILLNKSGSAGVAVSKKLSDVLDNRYMILYISSLGAIVLDLQQGGIFSIR